MQTVIGLVILAVIGWLTLTFIVPLLISVIGSLAYLAVLVAVGFAAVAMWKWAFGGGT
jgi:hypothetical protein